MNSFFEENSFFKNAMAADEKFKYKLCEDGITPSEITGVVGISLNKSCNEILANHEAVHKESIKKAKSVLV